MFTQLLSTHSTFSVVHFYILLEEMYLLNEYKLWLKPLQDLS